ncbi:MAG: hypothetical protein CME39_10440 [Haliea sp.]|nr:hypothetical protein [Haliea sp.]|tara:strand:+ start:1077 stop:2003 length:927 start_codon:yes stop_codon:yes gene_type:complete
MSEKEYLILRYSLVEESQQVLESKPIPAIKGHAILPAIAQDRELKNNGVLYSVLGFHELKPSFGYDYPGGRLYIGKLAKLKKQQTGEKVPGDIVEFEHDNWIPITVVIDIDTQHIFVRKDWRFGTPEHIARSLQVAFSEPIFSVYNHRVFIEGKSEASTFWNIVESKSKIYRLDFKLISPNILDTNQKARDALESLKEVFGQDEIDISLKNENGDLKIPEEPISNYLDYIAEGEGSWSVVTEGDRGGKKAHSSNENIDTVNLPEIYRDVADNNQLQLDHKEDDKRPENYEEASLGAEVYATIKDMEKD